MDQGRQLLGRAGQSSSRSGRLSGLEALRGIAAVAVVLYHVARYIDRNLGAPLLVRLTQFGHSGVDLFFVLSGFVILSVHAGDTGQPERFGPYVVRRVTRVLPIYWVALALTMALSWAGGHASPPLAVIAMSAVLLPSWTEPILGVAWTLQYEVVFYAIFGLLIINRLVGLALLWCWLAGIVLACAGLLPWARHVPPQIFDACDAEFFLGMAAALYLGRSTPARPKLLLATGALLFAAAALSEDSGWLDGYAASARLAYGLPSGLLIMGIVACERSGRLDVAGWLAALGGASYAIYLFQFAIIGIVSKAWFATAAKDGPAWVLYAVLVGAAVGGGTVLSVLVERPLLRMIRGKARAPSLKRRAKELLFD